LSRAIDVGHRRPTRGVALGVAALLLFGCQTLIGIEDRVYDPNAGAGGANGGAPANGGASATAGEGGAPVVTELCRDYCSDVMANCTGELQVYGSVDVCLGVCALLDPGDPLEPTAGNTAACRANQAEFAGMTGEPRTHCPRAAPGGGDLCGSDCDSYCLLLDRACSFTFDDCPEKCAAFATPGAYHSSILDGDTLWCRLTHVSAAASSPDLHCDHTGVLPTASCVDDATSEPSCEDYCRVVNVACTDELAVYESDAQCLAVCEALPPGTIGDRAENTVGCRKYHAHAALIGPADHCAHTSPTGDGTCGEGVDGICASYCRVAEAACPAEYGQAFTDTADCLARCALVPGGAGPAGYAVGDVESGDSVGCRVLHAARAFAEPSACAAVFGATPCVD